MIKQFKIIDIRIENDGSRTIAYSVYKANEDKSISGTSTAINIPANVTDIDDYMFNFLVKLGWING